MLRRIKNIAGKNDIELNYFKVVICIEYYFSLA